MSDLLLPLTAAQVMTRLGINAQQLVHAMRAGLKPYESDADSFDHNYRVYKLYSPASPFPTDLNYETSESRRLIDSLMFLPPDVEAFVRRLRGHSQEKEASKKPFPCKDGTLWSQVRITFIDNETVRIETPEGKDTCNYAELGFKDKRSGKPDQLWIMMRFLAEHQEINSRTPTPQAGSVSKTISRLNKRLKDVFKINLDPVPPYKQNKYRYKTKLELSDNREKGSKSQNDDAEPQSLFEEESSKWDSIR